MASNSQNTFTKLSDLYPSIQEPAVIGAPMRLIALAPLATGISKAGGIGFLGVGTETDTTKQRLEECVPLLKAHPGIKTIRHAGKDRTVLPVGMGVILHSASLRDVVVAFSDPSTPLPCAVWLFAPSDEDSGDKRGNTFANWVPGLRAALPRSVHIWIQVGSVKAAVEVCTASTYAPPEVLVVQGVDAGGHGLTHGAGVMSLLPEVSTRLEEARTDSRLECIPALVAAGGIADGRGLAAALALGAQGGVMGTRYLASYDAEVKDGYQREVLRASDGGQTTVRTKVYDTLRGTLGWPSSYGGRGVINATYHDFLNGMHEEENKKLYEAAVQKGDDGWGPHGRMTTYAGGSVGLVREVKSAGEITKEVRDQCREVLKKLAAW